MSIIALLTSVVSAFAGIIQSSTTLPGGDNPPEYLYTLANGNNYVCGVKCSPTQNANNYGLFAFYKADRGGDEAYYIYNYKANKWLTYAKGTSYQNQTGFITLSDQQDTASYFKIHLFATNKYEIQPYVQWTVSNKYLNWYKGKDFNPYDGDVTLGLWEQNGSTDPGSSWKLTRVLLTKYTYTVNAPDGINVSYEGKTYTNGQTFNTDTPLSPSSLIVPTQEGKFPAITIRLTSEANGTIKVKYVNIPSTSDFSPFTSAAIYPQQQTQVGEANLNLQVAEGDSVYTFSNKVLSAAFVQTGGALYFGGSKAMNLEAGTEPFSVAFGSGTVVNASSMTLKSIKQEDLAANDKAVGGAEHYAGKALVANYEYVFGDSLIQIEWRAVLRDGSHYLRTEMKLKGANDIDMFNVIPMSYKVNAKDAGSMPAVVGNTRGAVIMNNKIFAGLENPVGYNTVGDATGDESQWDLEKTEPSKELASTVWTQAANAEAVPARIGEVSGKTYTDIYTYNTTEALSLEEGKKVEVTLDYKAGANRFNIDGVELVENGSAQANDFHFGFAGNQKENNVYSIIVPHNGNYTLRIYIDKREPITATGTLTVKTYKPKAGVVISTDIVAVKGRWSRNTTLKKGDTWKISSVVGLIAQDGTQNEKEISKTQKRRSFLAYSERERAVPWRPFPVYISWYELNIDRNNNPDPTKNMTAEQVLDVERHWLKDFYKRYSVGPKAFVIDDGWDIYGQWKFHSGFPHEMRDMADSAKTMHAGVGAWLGPVGGYGKSGDFRRDYWKNNGTMVLSNPKYYKVFLDAAYNLTKNNGDFRFFKFDGISKQFSAVGPNDGDQGNEDAEGIIRLEQFVRDSLRRDIFFNTTVGTWASPFWYHITDATWRQENDYDESKNSSTVDRERWITYRDQLVYKNYVINSPVCPINTLMTHGFTLTTHGNVSKNMEYENVLRELRAAFVCGSGMVELYNDYALMNSINNGALWADLAECIQWQKRNADVLPDIHWVGGNPWNGSETAVYGWASWNGAKATLALRNGGDSEKTYSFTLREALNIPATVTSGSILLRKSFGVQAALNGLAEGQPINIDDKLNVTLPARSLFCFDGKDSNTQTTNVSTINITSEGDSTNVAVNKTLVLRATTNDDATFPALEWESSNTDIATVINGLVVPVATGTVTITAKATDGSNTQKSIEVTVMPKAFEPYACNFEKDAAGTATHRSINTITLTPKDKTAQTLSIGVAKPYVDKVDQVLTCAPGEELTVSFAINGGWMNGYVFIDRNNDGIFQFTPNSLDQNGTDVMSYSFYTGNINDEENGQNSAGTAITGINRNTMVCPSFQAPDQPGIYRIRFKMDWNSVDPGGRIAADGTLTGTNGFFTNSGSIVDATLKVDDGASGITTTEASSTDAVTIYDLYGRKLTEAPTHGVYIVNGKKVVR